MTLQQRPDMLDDDNNQWLRARAGERFCIRIPAPLTNNAYSITEFLASPGDSTPIHVHQNEDEHYFVLEGTVRFLIGERSFDASVGEWIVGPRGIPHAWGNATDTAIRMVVMCTPGGCEEALRDIALAKPDADLLAISNRYNVSVIGPPLLG